MEWKYCRDEKPTIDQETGESRTVFLAYVQDASDDGSMIPLTVYSIGAYTPNGWVSFEVDLEDGETIIVTPVDPVFWMLPTDPFLTRDDWEVDYYKYT